MINKIDFFKKNLGEASVEKQKIHPAIEYFNQLRIMPPSKPLSRLLLAFNEPKRIDPETFATGVKQFIKLANSNPLASLSVDGRKSLYGNIFLGLHYDNDLVKSWNLKHPECKPIDSSHVAGIAPSMWNSTLQDGFYTLIYKGQQPAEALDQLIKGPAVIDCGMFAQLSLWFGIRYMLGNERFNECFGRTPFYITQSVYNNIEDSTAPYIGNPLYSFLSMKDKAITPSVTLKHIANSPLYQLKHPGGNYGGENCIVIDDQYYIFDPELSHTEGLSKSDVLNLLREAFNGEQVQYDRDRLSLYAENREELHPKLLQTYGQLIEAAESLSKFTLTEEEFLDVPQPSRAELTFDFHKFLTWLDHMEKKTEDDVTEYVPLTIEPSRLPPDLLEAIPFENKMLMQFDVFKQDTAQQKELIKLSQQFCQSVMTEESKLVILSGKAGVGKTAAAVCAAKELASRGKKIAWISEVTVKGWADQAKSIADLDKCGLEIDALLSTNPDAVFLDDDNLAGHSGTVLLEKIYNWYVANPGKGLFITSNEPVTFKDCYGFKLDGRYHYPPFSNYSSPQYLNWHQRIGLSGESLRARREGQSIGAIVSRAAYQTHESELGHVELIPSIDDSEELAPIRRSLHATGLLGPDFDKLRPVQQKWVEVYETGGFFSFFGGRSEYEKPYLTANTSKFEKTACKTIALEIGEYNSFFDGKQVDLTSMEQLMRVLNYAHDQGGRRVILINQTSFSTEQLLDKIKTQLPKSEQERTWSRLMLMLCENEETIFDHNEFSGCIESISDKATVAEFSKQKPPVHKRAREDKYRDFFLNVGRSQRRLNAPSETLPSFDRVASSVHRNSIFSSPPSEPLERAKPTSADFNRLVAEIIQRMERIEQLKTESSMISLD